MPKGPNLPLSIYLVAAEAKTSRPGSCMGKDTLNFSGFLVSKAPNMSRNVGEERLSGNPTFAEGQRLKGRPSQVAVVY